VDTPSKLRLDRKSSVIRQAFDILEAMSLSYFRVGDDLKLPAMLGAPGAGGGG
jgi:hypothetical protein